VRETLTVVFSCGSELLALGVAVSIRGASVGGGSVCVAVSVNSVVSEAVGLLVNVCVIVGVSEGVNVGGGSLVGV